MKKEIEELSKELSDDYCEQYDDGQGRWCDMDCEVCRAERIYKEGYRKIDQTHKQLQEENVQMPVAKDLPTLLLAEAEYYCDSEGHIDSDKFANVLIENGYHKTVWHKVANGDLPKENMKVCCFYKNENYDVGKLISAWGKYKWDLNCQAVFVELNDVIAWTELPLYEGEE